MNKDQFVKTLNDYLLAHGYARWESWDINFEWGRYQRGRSWSNEFFPKREPGAPTRNEVLEEAAKLCDEMPCDCCWHEDAQIMAETCAASIRAIKGAKS